MFSKSNKFNIFKTFEEVLCNRLEIISKTESNKLKIYKNNANVIIREIETNDGIRIEYNKDKGEFLVTVLDDLGGSLISHSINKTSDKIRFIKKIDKSLNLNLVNWDWDWE